MKRLFSRFKKKDKKPIPIYGGLTISVKDDKYVIDFGGGKIIREDGLTLADIMDIIVAGANPFTGFSLVRKRHGITEESKK